MSVVAERLSQINLGALQIHNNLALFPLTSAESVEPHYQLLDEALAQGCARVTEVSETGSVTELKFVNNCDLPVLLLDGEELVGAKQNRILNLTVLAPSHKTIVIPVSCVEAGRWRAESAEFSSAKRAHFSRGRARKAAHVTESLRTVGSRRSNQEEGWADISEKAVRMDASSDTNAAAARCARGFNTWVCNTVHGGDDSGCCHRCAGQTRFTARSADADCGQQYPAR